MATHFDGPLIVQNSGSVIPGLLADGTADTLTIANDGSIGGDLDVGNDLTVGNNIIATGQVVADLAAVAKLNVGSGGELTSIVKTTIEVVVPAVAAASEADIAVAYSGLAVGDSIILNPPDAAVEANMGIMAVWASASDEFKIRVRNFHAVNALTGSTQNWTLIIVSS